MTLLEAIKARHSVRRYVDQPLEPATLEALEEAIDECNRAGGLHVQLVVDDPSAFRGLSSYGFFTGVQHYLVMAGPRAKDLDERVGYFGERLVLRAQQLGLNTCWVGLTYRKHPTRFTLLEGEKVACVIAIGYGATQGVERKSKTAEAVSNVSTASPQWFRDGVEAALLAPTAINQQKFFFRLTDRTVDDGRSVVEATRLFSLFGYTEMDLGIARLHFEVGAGTGNFVFEGEEKLG